MNKITSTAPRLLALLSGIVSTGVCVIFAAQYFSLYHNKPSSDFAYSIHQIDFFLYPLTMLPPWIAFFGWNRWPRVVAPRLLTLFVVIGGTVWEALYALDTNYFTTNYGDPLTFISGVIITPVWAFWYIVKAAHIIDSIVKRFTDKDEGIQNT